VRPSGERDPVAAAFNLGIEYAHLQRTGGIAAERRTALEFGVHRQDILLTLPPRLDVPVDAPGASPPSVCL
jgi:hypothetical protein